MPQLPPLTPEEWRVIRQKQAAADAAKQAAADEKRRIQETARQAADERRAAQRAAKAASEAEALAALQAKQEAAIRQELRARFPGSEEQFSAAWPELLRQYQLDRTLGRPVVNPLPRPKAVF